MLGLSRRSGSRCRSLRTRRCRLLRLMGRILSCVSLGWRWRLVGIRTRRGRRLDQRRLLRASEGCSIVRVCRRVLACSRRHAGGAPFPFGSSARRLGFAPNRADESISQPVVPVVLRTLRVIMSQADSSKVSRNRFNHHPLGIQETRMGPSLFTSQPPPFPAQAGGL